MSKIKVQKNSEIFKCPICGNEMTIYDLKSLICEDKHCFDLAKSGYINFLSRSVKTEYDRAMLRARNAICKSNFFKPLVEKISEIVLQQISQEDHGKRFILDVGCGEGSHLAQITSKLQTNTSLAIEGVGIDISKEGIQIASKEYPDCLWCVGDLAKTPFQDQTFGVILNILSPSNYAEFKRLITKDGILIKVVPGSQYLQELREKFYRKTAKQTYSNAKVVKLFSESFEVISHEELKYDVDLSQLNLEHLIQMTPLSWKVSEDTKQEVLNAGLKKITVDLTILCGKSC